MLTPMPNPPLDLFRGRAVSLHPPLGRVGPLRAGEGCALDSVPNPPLASLDPPGGSGCVVFQVVSGFFHGLFSLTIALRTTNSFRIQAVATTLYGLP